MIKIMFSVASTKGLESEIGRSDYNQGRRIGRYANTSHSRGLLCLALASPAPHSLAYPVSSPDVLRVRSAGLVRFLALAPVRFLALAPVRLRSARADQHLRCCASRLHTVDIVPPVSHHQRARDHRSTKQQQAEAHCALRPMHRYSSGSLCSSGS